MGHKATAGVIPRENAPVMGEATEVHTYSLIDGALRPIPSSASYLAGLEARQAPTVEPVSTPGLDAIERVAERMRALHEELAGDTASIGVLFGQPIADRLREPLRGLSHQLEALKDWVAAERRSIGSRQSHALARAAEDIDALRELSSEALTHLAAAVERVDQYHRRSGQPRPDWFAAASELAKRVTPAGVAG